jgi:hypothetical protein
MTDKIFTRQQIVTEVVNDYIIDLTAHMASLGWPSNKINARMLPIRAQFDNFIEFVKGYEDYKKTTGG